MGQDLGVSVWQLERPPPLLALGRLLVLVCGEERERRAHIFQCLDMCHNSHTTCATTPTCATTMLIYVPHPTPAQKRTERGEGGLFFFLSRSRIVL